MKTLKALFCTGRAEADSSFFFLFLSRGKTLLICCPQFILVAFFCTNTENCFNAGNWNYFNIFDCIPIFMSCWNVKCTWTVLLMLVCENMHFSVNPFCTRLALTVFTRLGKLSAFSPYCFKQIAWGSMITITSLIKTLILCCTQSCFGRSLSLPKKPVGHIIHMKLHTWNTDLSVLVFLGLFLNKLDLKYLCTGSLIPRIKQTHHNCATHKEHLNLLLIPFKCNLSLIILN